MPARQVACSLRNSALSFTFTFSKLSSAFSFETLFLSPKQAIKNGKSGQRIQKIETKKLSEDISCATKRAEVVFGFARLAIGTFTKNEKGIELQDPTLASVLQRKLI